MSWLFFALLWLTRWSQGREDVWESWATAIHQQVQKYFSMLTTIFPQLFLKSNLQPYFQSLVARGFSLMVHKCAGLLVKISKDLRPFQRTFIKATCIAPSVPTFHISKFSLLGFAIILFMSSLKSHAETMKQIKLISRPSLSGFPLWPSRPLSDIVYWVCPPDVPTLPVTAVSQSLVLLSPPTSQSINLSSHQQWDSKLN